MNNPTMSTKRRNCSGPSRDSLPVDLLLEIIARADVTTLVRCAATDSTLRCAILEPAFRRRLAANAGFDPTLLLGLSYRELDYLKDVWTEYVIQTQKPTLLRARLDTDCLRIPFKPVASRDGLLVVRRHPYLKVQLRTCDAFTGHVTHLPHTIFPNARLHVVLSVGDAGRSFELLLADMNLRSYKTFSTKDSKWSGIRRVKWLLPHSNQQYCDSYCSAVIGRTVYWPCSVNFMRDWNRILALDVDAGEVTSIELPPGCSPNCLRLARVRGRLCMLLQEERRGISMWTLTSSVAGTWSRQVVISNLEITRQAGLGALTYCLVGFGQNSGVVILNAVLKLPNQGRYLLQLDLGTKEETPVVTCLARRGNAVYVGELFLHEVDLNSLLQPMKHF